MVTLFRSLVVWLALGLSTLAGAQGAFVSPPVQSPYSRAELLVHAPQGVAPGRPVWLGLQITHEPDWHTYWKNPGDSGLPTELEWQLPAGVVPGPIQWPTPRKFPLGDLANYGYDGTVLLPVPMDIRADFAGTTLQAELWATWLICRKECIPEEARFQLRVPVDASVAAHAAAFEAAWAAAPADQPAGRSLLAPEPDGLRVELTGLPADWVGQPLEFYPELPGLIEPGAAWTQSWTDGVWHARVPLSRFRTATPESVPLVVAWADPPGQGPGLPGIRMAVPVTQAWPPPQTPVAGASDALKAALAENAARAAAAPDAAPWTLWTAVLGALLGGLILNLMPCVFPVLAIKVLAFAQHGADRRQHRMAGLAYTAGVVLSFVALGALLLALRAAGEQLGWGFQLQNPLVVSGLIALLAVLGLNLAGLFEFGHVLPSSVASMQARHPTADAFLTGVLATAVASPCTAPFMGASLGVAITLPASQALLVFAALGLGMALPYALASWVPAVARVVPRPGPWMVRVRQVLAFPLFATVVWLLWVLGQQTGIDAVALVLMALVVLTLLIWAWGAGGRWRWMVGTPALAGLVWIGMAAAPYVVTSSTDAPRSAAPGSSAVGWQAWSPQTEAEWLAQGRPVFVDYTAAWCVTCQFNKHNALADPVFLQHAAQRGVVLLRADWTRRDPAVTESLARLGRNGVPVYVLQAPGQPPVVLSELLTVQMLTDALQRL